MSQKNLVKFLILPITLLTLCLCVACGGKEKLYVLNWGEYIDPDLITAFEEENNCTVVYSTSTSCEDMYVKVVTEQAPYDIVVPSDYMIEKMHNEGLLKPIETSLLSNYSNDLFNDNLKKLMDSSTCQSYAGYYIPYFWGSLGIMYRNTVPGLQEAIEQYGWAIFFDQSLLPSGTKVAMYESERDVLTMAECYLGIDLNCEEESEIRRAFKAFEGNTYVEWGADTLKSSILSGNIDVTMCYAGDFIDNYYLYRETHETGDLPFSCYTPQDWNNVYFDAMVIPTTSQNTALAHKWIDFMISYDGAMANAQYVGYVPTVKAVYNDVINDPEMAEIASFSAYHPETIMDYPDGHYAVYKSLDNSIYELISNLFSNLKTNQ